MKALVTKWWQDFWSNQSPDNGVSKLSDFAFSYQVEPDTLARLEALSVEILKVSGKHANAQELSQCNNLVGQLDYLSRTDSFKIGYCEKAAIATDAIFQSIYEQVGLADKIYGVQYPTELRCIHGKPPPNYLEGKYPTDDLHCDFWGGEPPDIVTVVLFMSGEFETNRIALFEPDFDVLSGSHEPIASYDSLRESDFKKLTPIDYTPKPGMMLVFDGHCPHRTDRRSGMRLCFNTRLRITDPYATIDERWDKPQTGWGRYWYPNSNHDQSFSQRLASEIAQLEQKNMEPGELQTAIDARKHTASNLQQTRIG